MQTLGTTHIKTTAYHHCGLVERFYHQLKTALAAQPDATRWNEYLLIVLLGFRSTIKEDIKSTAVEMVYGTTLRLAGEFFTQPNQKATSTSNCREGENLIFCFGALFNSTLNFTQSG